MSPDTWQLLQTGGALANLTDHVRLSLSGPDAVRYLNGQVTNDVRKLHPGQALTACVTNHKGKLEAFVYLTTDAEGSLFISGPADLRDFLPLRLEKYLIADDCRLDDLTGSTALLHVIAPLEKITPHLLPDEHPAATSRFGLPGYDLWTTPERLPFWSQQFPALSGDDLSTLEVIFSIPAWGAELTPDLLPPEAGLDATAIDYHKGCYIGQEVISRIRSVGRVNRLLTHLIQTEGPPVERGFFILPPDLPGPEETANLPTPRTTAGQITRTAAHPITGQIHALAFLRRGSCGPFRSGPDITFPNAVLHPKDS